MNCPDDVCYDSPLRALYDLRISGRWNDCA